MDFRRFRAKVSPLAIYIYIYILKNYNIYIYIILKYYIKYIYTYCKSFDCRIVQLSTVHLKNYCEFQSWDLHRRNGPWWRNNASVPPPKWSMVEKQRLYVTMFSWRLRHSVSRFLKPRPNGKTIHFGLHLRLARQLPVNFEQLELIEAFLGSSGMRRWHRFGTFGDWKQWPRWMTSSLKHILSCDDSVVMLPWGKGRYQRDLKEFPRDSIALWAATVSTDSWYELQIRAS